MCFSETGSHSIASFLSFSMAGIAGVSQHMPLPVTDINQFYSISLLRLEPGALHLIGKYGSDPHLKIHPVDISFASPSKCMGCTI